MDLFKLFESKADHPMATTAGALEALLPLKTQQPLDAVQQLAHWAGTLRDTDGFACDDRLVAVKIVDDFARPIVAELFTGFLARLHVQDRVQHRSFDVLHDFWHNLSGAYRRCVSDNEHGERGAERVHCLHYLGIPNEAWANLYRTLAFAKVAKLDEYAVVLYPKEVHTTPRAELLKLLGLSLCAPDERPADQVELAWRIPRHRSTSR